MKQTDVSVKNKGSPKSRIEAEEKNVLQDVTMCEGQQSKDIPHSLSSAKQYRNVLTSQEQGQADK